MGPTYPGGMARSPLTLAASVTAALPGIGVTAVGPLTENGPGRFDSAFARLEDGRAIVVRMPVDDAAARDLATESRALHALTPGVRALLPFAAPEVLGETGSGTQRVLVVDHLGGYRIDPANLPKGPGYAPAIGAAIAAVHALPVSVVRTDGLPVRSPEQVRDDVARLLDRVDATDRVPDGLMLRWRRALEVDELWRFESAVVLGGASSSSFLLVDDDEGIPHVTGLLDWAGLSVGDPAVDLRWLASAPTAMDDVHDGYGSRGDRSPDPLLRERARLYAELEFARWLVHGWDAGEGDVVDDAVALLSALADGVRGDHIVPDSRTDIDDAMALVERVPPTAATPVDTSMQTDAYDPEALSLYLAAERDRLAAEESSTSGSARENAFDLTGLREPEEEGATVPVDLDGWAPARTGSLDATPDEPAAGAPLSAVDPPRDVSSAQDEEDAVRASRAALRRWAVAGDDDARESRDA